MEKKYPCAGDACIQCHKELTDDDKFAYLFTCNLCANKDRKLKSILTQVLRAAGITCNN